MRLQFDEPLDRRRVGDDLVIVHPDAETDLEGSRATVNEAHVVGAAGRDDRVAVEDAVGYRAGEAQICLARASLLIAGQRMERGTPRGTRRGHSADERLPLLPNWS
jgi:hypothetical protein